MDQTEAELESFRQKWREEVKAKKSSKPSAAIAPQAFSYNSHHQGASKPPVSTQSGKQKQEEAWDDYEPRNFNDVEPRAPGLKLDGGLSYKARNVAPQSALEHYEEAVAKETIGKLGDSVSLYRKAFKLDDRVHESYKKKHFPASGFPPKARAPQSSNELADTSKAATQNLPTVPGTALSDLLSEFSSLSIQGEPPPTELSPPPPCPIASLPEEILTEILLYVAVHDIAAFTRVAKVCKRLAYLVMTEERIWRRVATGHEFGFAAMHYKWACLINGDPLFPETEQRLGSVEIVAEDEVHDFVLTEPSLPTLKSLVPEPYRSYRMMFRQRPRIRFNGCYISTVNYTRPGASSPTQITWNSPVLIVTYYRYLRFFRNGTVISLLTVAEPQDVVHHLTPENMHSNHTGALPQSVMKDALPGRWRLSGPDDAVQTSSEGEESEVEGSLHVETDGSVPKYMFRMAFTLGSAGRGARNNKLSWQGYWSYNKTTDDWGEFGLKHDKPYYWSRVKSFGTGL